MAIKGTWSGERIDFEIEGVVLQISRITSAERAKVEQRIARQNRGEAPLRLVMDDLMPKHIHSYRPNREHPDPWVYHEGEKVEPADFDPGMVLSWPEDVKADIFDEMHKNDRGEDTRELAKEGKDQLGNLKPGSTAAMNLTD